MGERSWPHGRPTLGQHVRTTTIAGFLRVRLLTWLKPLRPVSYRAREEHAQIERWLDGVRGAQGVGDATALELARAGQLVKGYGEVRRRLAALLDTLREAAHEAGALEAAKGGDGAITAALVSRFRGLVLEGPDGEARAPVLAAETSRGCAPATRPARGRDDGLGGAADRLSGRARRGRGRGAPGSSRAHDHTRRSRSSACGGRLP